MAFGCDDDRVLFMPGFRFYPTEEELLTFYLPHRLAGTRPDADRVIPVVDIYGYHPSELKAMAGAANVGDAEQWLFFCPRAERELHGGRPVRTTPSGYWKATGSPSYVFSASANRVIGEKRTMVFYQGRAPSGCKTRWKMNEYKAAVAAHPAAGATPPATAPTITLRNEFTVCRVYISTGTLRSFDRRPFNPSVVHDDPAAAAHQHQQQLQQEQALAPAANTSGLQQLAGGAEHVVGNNERAENSHDSSSPGSPGVVEDFRAEDTAAAIDWDSLITASAGELGFSVGDDFNGAIWPQI